MSTGAAAPCAAGANGLSPSTVANTSIVANTSLDDSTVLNLSTFVGDYMSMSVAFGFI